MNAGSSVLSKTNCAQMMVKCRLNSSEQNKYLILVHAASTQLHGGGGKKLREKVFTQVD